MPYRNWSIDGRKKVLVLMKNGLCGINALFLLHVTLAEVMSKVDNK